LAKELESTVLTATPLPATIRYGTWSSRTGLWITKARLSPCDVILKMPRRLERDPEAKSGYPTSRKGFPKIPKGEIAKLRVQTLGFGHEKNISPNRVKEIRIISALSPLIPRTTLAAD
jgi:hypothetical protein